MHILKTAFDENPNVGLYGYCNDTYCLLGKSVPKKIVEEIKKVLKVPVHTVTISGSSLIGALCTGNDTCLLLPDIIYEEELKIFDKLKIEYKVINTKLTAFGNNILCNNNGCLVNPDFSAVVKKQIRQALNVSLNPGKIADIDVVGSCCVFNSKGALIHPEVSKSEREKVEKLLGVKCTKGSVNFGSPYVRAGVLCNSNGFVVGRMSTGVEARDIDEALGFL